MNCKSCNKNHRIVNKKYNLCSDCNDIRLHGATKKSIYLENSRKKKSKIDIVKKKYIEVLKVIDINREKICAGCGLKNVILSHSHIISQKDCKNYGLEHLIYDSNNIAFHCIGMYNDNDCHKRWENPTKRKELLDYDKNMEYIKSQSIVLYNKYLCG